MTLATTSLSLSQRLALILGTLRAALAAGMSRGPARVALLLQAWPYLVRLEARFTALVARVASGRFAVRAPRPGPTTPRERGPGQSMPRHFGWMMQLTPAVLPLRSQIQHLLHDPEVAALLAAAPQAGRILRPLCHMLGIAAVWDLPAALHTPLPRRPARAAAPIVSPEAPASDTRPPTAAVRSEPALRNPMPA